MTKAPPMVTQTDSGQGLEWLPREYPHHPADSLTPARAAVLLRDAEQGNLMSLAQLADDMEERDAHLFAELSKRRSAVLHVPWALHLDKPSKQEEAGIDQLYTLLQQLDLPRLLFGMSDAIHKGYANTEMAWTRQDGGWLPTTLEHRPASWFMTHQHARHELRLRDMTGEGSPLHPYNWIQHHHPARSGYLGNQALARVTVWPFLFRHFAGRDFAEFLEVYGLPILLGRYDSAATKEDKTLLLNAVRMVGRSARGTLPLGMQIDVLEATKGDADPFVALLKWAEESISKAILGGTLTSSVDGKGSYAAATVHDGVRKELRDADLMLIARTLNRDLITPLARFNTALERIPELVFETQEPEDITRFADALPKLAGMMPIPVWWVQEKLQIPAAQEGEAVLGTPKLTPKEGMEDKAETRTFAQCPQCSTATLKANPTDDNTQQALDIALQAEDLQTTASSLLQPLLDKVRSATSEAELLGLLAEIDPQQDDSALTRQLNRLLFMADTSARLAAQEELD